MATCPIPVHQEPASVPKGVNDARRNGRALGGAPASARVVPEDKPKFWSRSRVIALARAHCSQCYGSGLRWSGITGSLQPCGCVLREIFRACLSKYRYIQEHQGRTSMVTKRIVQCGMDSKRFYSRRNEDFCADFCLVARRTLDDLQYRIFDLHFLQRFDWRHCVRALNIDRGNFFHSVYRIEQRLGRVFTELRPYALYPVDEYFSLTEPRVGVLPDGSITRRTTLTPPLRAAA
jgi:hypothetical protein